MANQFREAVIPRLTDVVGRGDLSGGLVLREIEGGDLSGELLSGGSCPGDLSGGRCPTLVCHVFAICSRDSPYVYDMFATCLPRVYHMFVKSHTYMNGLYAHI